MTGPGTRIVEQTVRIAASPETVWRYWTHPKRMCDWWGAAELDPRPGGSCRIAMGAGPTMRGEYLEVVPYERIVFSFGWEPTDGAPDIAPGSTRVEVTLTPDDGDTILTLRHTGLPAAHADEHRAGWAHFLPASPWPSPAPPSRRRGREHAQAHRRRPRPLHRARPRRPRCRDQPSGSLLRIGPATYGTGRARPRSHKFTARKLAEP